MELRLFESPIVSKPASRAPKAPPLELDELAPTDAQLHVAERYLAEYSERYGDVASLQAVISLSADESAKHLDIDEASFPRSARALSRVRQLQSTDEVPEGFWIRFLLQQLPA